jgi:hypothetical protein
LGALESVEQRYSVAVLFEGDVLVSDVFGECGGQLVRPEEVLIKVWVKDICMNNLMHCISGLNLVSYSKKI